MIKIKNIFLVLVLIFNFPSISNSKNFPGSFADLAERLMPSVVNISTTQTVVTNSNPFPNFQFPPGSPFEDMFKEFGTPQERKSSALGSGFIIDEKGIIVTNNHVIDGCGDVKIHHNGNVIRASVVSRDKTNDLAVLKGDFEPEMVFPINEKNAKLMQEIYVAGYPFGSKISASLKITRGIISSLSGIGNNFSNIQIDAAIQPGNSGGPIFNKSGTVIGVAAHKLDLKYSLEKMGSIPENVNFGIKSSVLANFLDSNSVSYKSGSRRTKGVSALGKLASNATYYLSCWMTMAQIEDMKAEKVLFSNLK